VLIAVTVLFRGLEILLVVIGFDEIGARPAGSVRRAAAFLHQNGTTIQDSGGGVTTNQALSSNFFCFSKRSRARNHMT